MEHALFAFCRVFLGLVLFTGGMNGLFPYRRKPSFLFLLTICASVFAFLSDLMLPAAPWIWFLSTAFFLILIIEYGIGGEAYPRRICAVILLAGITLCAFFSKMQIFSGISFSDLGRLPLSAWLCYIPVFFFTGFIFLCAYRILVKAVLFREDRKLYLQWLPVLFFPVSQYLLIDRFVFPKTLEGNFLQPVMLAATVLLAIAADYMISAAIRDIVRNREEKVRYESLLRQISIKETYYRKLSSQIEQVQHLRHDLNNHVSALKILLENHDREELSAYLETIRQTGLFENRTIFCDHPVADLFLCEKSRELEKDGIGLDTDLMLDPKEDSGRLLLALESLLRFAEINCADVPEKKVLLSSAQDEGRLSISVSFPEREGSVSGDDLAGQLGEMWHGNAYLDHDNGRCTVRLDVPEVAA